MNPISSKYLLSHQSLSLYSACLNFFSASIANPFFFTTFVFRFGACLQCRLKQVKRELGESPKLSRSCNLRMLPGNSFTTEFFGKVASQE